MLTVIDGLDGSGKTTQFERCRKRLTDVGTQITPITFPDYENPSSALVKLYLSGELGTSPDDVGAYAASSFYAVDRYASYVRYWREAYEKGTHILAARYTTSNAIHQMGKLPRNEWDRFLDWLYDYEYNKLTLPKPDCVIFLDMTPEVAMRLVSAREGEQGKDIHEKDRAYMLMCREAALYAAQCGGWRLVRCDDGCSPYPAEVVERELFDILKGILA